MTIHDAPARSRVASFMLLGGPLLMGAGGHISPSTRDDGASLITTAVDHPGAWTAGWLLIVAGAGVLLVGLAHLASLLPRRARLATTGLVLLALGTFGQATTAAAELLIVPIAEGPREAAVATVDRIGESTGLLILFVLFVPPTLFGGLLLFAGLRVSGVLPLWAALLGGASTVFSFFAEDAVPGGELVTAVATCAAFLPAVLTRVSLPTRRAGSQSPALSGSSTG